MKVTILLLILVILPAVLGAFNESEPILSYWLL